MEIRNLDQLYREDVKLIAFIRELGFGSFEVTVKNGKPVFIKQPLKTIKLEEGGQHEPVR